MRDKFPIFTWALFIKLLPFNVTVAVESISTLLGITVLSTGVLSNNVMVSGFESLPSLSRMLLFPCPMVPVCVALRDRVIIPVDGLIVVGVYSVVSMTTFALVENPPPLSVSNTASSSKKVLGVTLLK